MGNKSGKEGTGDVENTSSQPEPKQDWRSRMSGAQWHRRFSRNPADQGGKRGLKDKIQKLEVQSIRQRGEQIMEYANPIVDLYKEYITLYKKAGNKASRVVTGTGKKLSDYELKGGVKLTDFVDAYSDLKKLTDKAKHRENNPLLGSMTVQQLDVFNTAYSRLAEFTEQLHRAHTSELPTMLDEKSGMEADEVNALRNLLEQYQADVARIGSQDPPEFARILDPTSNIEHVQRDVNTVMENYEVQRYADYVESLKWSDWPDQAKVRMMQKRGLTQGQFDHIANFPTYLRNIQSTSDDIVPENLLRQNYTELINAFRTVRTYIELPDDAGESDS